MKKCWEQLRLPAQRRFSDENDGIQESLFLRNVPGGVMMTGNGEFFAEVWLNRLDFDTSDAQALLFDLEVLRKRVEIYLSPGFERQVCLRELLILYRGLLGALDNEVTRPGDDRGRGDRYRAELAELRRELADAEQTFVGFLRPRAEQQYMRGTLLGVVISAVLVGAIALGLALADAGGFWAAVASAGALGAVTSVWMRLRSKELQVDIDAEKWDLIVGGASRPLVGALSALGIYVFVEAGIVPLDLPANPDERQFFLAAISFLAGFSERLAADTFGRGAASVSTVARAGG
jgi:hypothetical protein